MWGRGIEIERRWGRERERYIYKRGGRERERYREGKKWSVSKREREESSVGEGDEREQ